MQDTQGKSRWQIDTVPRVSPHGNTIWGVFYAPGLGLNARLVPYIVGVDTKNLGRDLPVTEFYSTILLDTLEELSKIFMSRAT